MLTSVLHMCRLQADNVWHSCYMAYLWLDYTTHDQLHANSGWKSLALAFCFRPVRNRKISFSLSNFAYKERISGQKENLKQRRARSKLGGRIRKKRKAAMALTPAFGTRG
jgi:hypothetical protein